MELAHDTLVKRSECGFTIDVMWVNLSLFLTESQLLKVQYSKKQHECWQMTVFHHHDVCSVYPNLKATACSIPTATSTTKIDWWVRERPTLEIYT